MWDMVKEVLKKIGGWFVELLIWALSFLYDFFNDALQYLFDTGVELVLAALNVVGQYIPDDVESSITDSFEYLEYINTWVPVSFFIKLITAYITIWVTLVTLRKLKSIIPFVGK